MLSLLFVVGCTSTGERAGLGGVGGDLSIYRRTNDQIGHEWVKTEQFLVPVGKPAAVPGLQFGPHSAALTPRLRQILSQVFNSIEEITENTVGDTNALRVAEFSQMRFEVRGYANDATSASGNAMLGRERANAVMGYLTTLGTPTWRFHSRGFPAPANSPSKQIEFVRIQ